MAVASGPEAWPRVANETYEPPFRGSIVISQNNAVNASEAILSRIIHLNFDRSEQTKASGEAADALKFMDVDDVSGFILAATNVKPRSWIPSGSEPLFTLPNCDRKV